MINQDSVDLEIKKAAQLSLVEISIGSLGHGFKVPLTGQALSLNQLAFLLNAINKDQLPVSSVFEISSIAAVLKSFSVAGQKLGPMLSIAMQGFLFWLMNLIFKKKLVGQILGSILLALWSFIQPLLTYFLIYGFQLIKIFEYYEKKLAQDFSFIHQSILIGVSTVLVLKTSFAIALALYSHRTKKEIQFLSEMQIQKLTSQMHTTQSSTSAWRAALKDLSRPLFLISFLLMILFVWQFEVSITKKIWIAMRPLATAYILFYLLRSPFVAAQLLKLSKKSESFNRIYQKSKKALDLVAEWSTRSSEISARRKLE
jgi:hypothetical protein